MYSYLLNDLWQFNTTTNQWSYLEAQASPSPRGAFGFAALDGCLFVFGGSSNVNDFYIFDIKRCMWTELAPSPTTPSPRIECGMVAMDKMLYLFGGGLTQGGVYGELLQYLLLAFISFLQRNCLIMFSSQDCFLQICIPLILWQGNGKISRMISSDREFLLDVDTDLLLLLEACLFSMGVGKLVSFSRFDILSSASEEFHRVYFLSC
jgi:hypothetical protein